MMPVIIISVIVVGISIILLGINILVLGRKFPETEVGKNRHMIRLGLRCPQCEEREKYRKLRPVKVDVKSLRPNWEMLRTNE